MSRSERGEKREREDRNEKWRNGGQLSVEKERVRMVICKNKEYA